MKHLAQENPYNNTKIYAGRSKVDIDEMLKEFGAIGIRWTEEGSLKGTECPKLEFILEIDVKGVKKQIGVKIQPPLLMKSVGRGYSKKHTPNLNASMRMLYWYLKSRMEAVKFGMDDVFETFMSHIIVPLPNHTDSTLGKVIREEPKIFSQILPSFEIIMNPALEELTKNGS